MTCPKPNRGNGTPKRCRPPLPATMPLFLLASRQAARSSTGPRLILRDDLRGAEGSPRACIVIPGRRLPLAVANLTTALAALRAVVSARATAASMPWGGDSRRSRRAAATATRLLHAEGQHAWIATLKHPDTGFNDLLRARLAREADHD